jgi:hypothetical protein
MAEWVLLAGAIAGGASWTARKINARKHREANALMVANGAAAEATAALREADASAEREAHAL